MFDKFDAEARRAVALAGNVATHYRQDHIGTGSMLFGVLAVAGQGLAPKTAEVIETLGADIQSIRDLVLLQFESKDELSPRHMPFTPNVKLALERTACASQEIGSSHIGAQHLLAGLAGNPASTAGKILASMGITDAAVIDATIREAVQSPTAARTFAVYAPVGKSIFKNGGKIYPDLATAKAAHPDQEIAPFAFRLAEGEFFDVGTVHQRFSSWGKFASYTDAFAAAEDFKAVQGADVQIRILVPNVMELRGTDSQGRDVVLGRSVEYTHVRMMSRIADRGFAES